MNSVMDQVTSIIKIKEEENKLLDHEKYIKALSKSISNNSEKVMEDIDIISYETLSEITICTEPLEFLHETNDFADDQVQCRAYFERRMIDFEKIQVPQIEEYTWFNSSSNGINLRPGLLENEMSSPLAIKMGDQLVHGTVVGRTGSGKSVFLNNIILNLLKEYSPWELSLYLADFKKVELSRYMTKTITPHVNACAATSEIRYVLSLLDHLVSQMQARQTFLSRLGFQKLEDFRKEYNVVLPRVLLLVDEFQQLFLEATNKESEKINNLLMSIIKLGRATGFHLLFASQEMTGALSSKALANFKIRIALPCESEISQSILGNTAAANLEIGEVYVNTGDGKEDKNKRFKVPYISADSGYFDGYLQQQKGLSEDFRFEKNQKYYLEDTMENMNALEEINERMLDFRTNLIEKQSDRYLDAFTLGRAVVYSNSKLDYESFFLEKGRNKNIMIVSPNVDRLAYIQQLLAKNFKSSPLKHETTHIYYSINPIVRNKYKIEEDLPNTIYRDSFEDFLELEDLYNRKIAVCEAFKISGRKINTFLSEYFKILASFKNSSDIKELKKYIDHRFQNEMSIVAISEIIEEFNRENNKVMLYPLQNFIDFINKNATAPERFLKPNVIWISGVENIERIPMKFENMLKKSMTYNILFIFSTTTTDGVFRTCISSCDYTFVDSTNPTDYERCKMNNTNKAYNAISIEFNIKSLNTERSFKRFKVHLGENIVPSIDYDKILG